MRLFKSRPSLVFLILLFLLLYSNYTPSNFVFENRVVFCGVVTLLMIIRLFTAKKKITKVDFTTLLLVFSFTYLSVLDAAKGLYASSVGSLMLALIILAINTYVFEKNLKQVIILNQFFDILSLIFFILAFYISERGRNVFGLSIPYFTSFTSQPSLIPALLVLPFAIYLIFYREYRIFYFTILTIAVCFSGNVYMAIFIAFILYFLINKFSKVTFILLPFFLMIVFLAGISYGGSSFWPKSIELRKQAKELVNKKGATDWKIERMISGTERFAYYYEQMVSTKENILFGSSSNKDFQSLGSVILKFGLRGGIVILLSMTVFIGILLSLLYEFNKSFPERRIGVVLIYSLIIQEVVYNEMGFYSLYAIALFYILIKLLKEKLDETASVAIHAIS
jgi:hypothetical protein